MGGSACEYDKDRGCREEWSPAEADRPRRLGGGGDCDDVAASTLELGLTVRTGRWASAEGTPLPASCSNSGPPESSDAFSAAAAAAAA